MSTAVSTTSQNVKRRSAFGWELRKAKGWWFYLLIVGVTVLGCLIGAKQYHDYIGEFQAQGITWLAVWGQATLLPAMFFFPLIIGSVVAQVTTNEREGRNWQRMTAYRVDGQVFRAKVMYCLYLAVITCLIFWAGFVATGLRLGFEVSGLTSLLPQIIPMILAVWTIALAAWWLGEACSSFATTMMFFLIATLAGSAIVVVAPAIATWYPLTLLVAACSSRDPGSVGAMGAVLTTSVVAIAWGIAFALLARRRIRSRQ